MEFPTADGNLAMYDGDKLIWSTNTAGNPGAELTLTPEGELQIVKGGTTLWSSKGAK